jgi:4-hydroxybenzoate polyprenyltransferase
MNRARILAFAQLLRIPNVFTAFADIAVGACVAAAVLPAFPGALAAAFVLIALASGCLYCAGMVWNDVFDLAEDTVSRAFRPIPSGRVRTATAVLLGTVLMACGLALAAAAGAPGDGEWNYEPLVYAAGIAVVVFAYDGGLKHTFIGPVAMAACRFLNVLFGLALVPESSFALEFKLHLAAVVGVYIVGVTWFARTEEGVSRSRNLKLAFLVVLSALVTALVLRAKLHDTKPFHTLGTVLFPYLLVAFGFLVGLPAARAIGEPTAKRVQKAVKRLVLGLVVLDAVLATMFVGAWGLLVVLLLLPAMLLGKWVYST